MADSHWGTFYYVASLGALIGGAAIFGYKYVSKVDTIDDRLTVIERRLQEVRSLVDGLALSKQGPAGERGPKGETGPAGPKGDAGLVVAEFEKRLADLDKKLRAADSTGITAKTATANPSAQDCHLLSEAASFSLSVNPGDKLCAGDGEVVATIDRTGVRNGYHFVEFSAVGKGRQYCGSSSTCNIATLPRFTFEVDPGFTTVERPVILYFRKR